MAKRMLIDATHPEETRVAVVDGNRLEEFDYESAYRKPLKGNIFLAKVTRVEPSLQACFVNYGGNRHGFLPFSEIHPDYFRIPVSDREALIEAQREEMEARRAAEEAEDDAEFGDKPEQNIDDEDDNTPPEEVVTLEAGHELPSDDEEEKAETSEEEQEKPKGRRPRRRAKKAKTEEVVEQLDTAEEPKAEERTSEEKAETTAEETSETEQATEAEAKTEEQNTEAKGSDAESDEDNIGNRIADEEANEISDEALDEEVNGNVASDNENEGEEQPQKRRGRGRYNNNRRGRGRGRGRYNNRRRQNSNARRVEVVGGDGLEGDQVQRPTLKKHYKIQEVIKRGQIMLIQASKEERGNKGAAVTTYLSLPGRYSVLMPNSPRAGGVSRKIANYKERKRMREILSDLSVPDGMSVIMRTAGTSRTKTEIKRDLDYLIRLWNKIRETTLESTAPELIYEEGSLTKRSIRDIYTRDIEEVLVAGADGYKETKSFMKMLIPSHAKRVQEYKEEHIPLFTRYQIEGQINEIGTPTVKLRSGGSLVIHPTEALVSIDVNSGRATKERHIEETALKTNLEAAEEVARQLRLRDLGGLVVIDFIDMENYRNNHKVERKMRDALSGDRARIQVGRISNFGLMELSRQRLNPSLAEAQYEPCSHCNGTGTVHTVDAAAIQALRALEEEGTLKRSSRIVLSVSNKVAIYILNNKRALLAEIENRYGFQCMIQVDENMPARQYVIEPIKDAPPLENTSDNEAEETTDSTSSDDNEDENKSKRSRGRGGRNRRGGRGGRNNRDRKNEETVEGEADAPKKADSQADTESEKVEKADSDDEGKKKKPARRGRRNTKKDDQETADSTSEQKTEAVEATEAEEKPKKKRGRPAKKKADEAETSTKDATEEKAADKPAKKTTRSKKKTDDSTAAETSPSIEASNDDAPSDAHKEHETLNEAPKKKKKGWWSRK